MISCVHGGCDFLLIKFKSMMAMTVVPVQRVLITIMSFASNKALCKQRTEFQDQPELISNVLAT